MKPLPETGGAFFLGSPQPGGTRASSAPTDAPSAKPLAPNAEGLLTAETALSMIAFAKAAADAVGHCAPPNIFRLMVKHNRYSVRLPFTQERRTIEDGGDLTP